VIAYDICFVIIMFALAASLPKPTGVNVLEFNAANVNACIGVGISGYLLWTVFNVWLGNLWVFGWQPFRFFGPMLNAEWKRRIYGFQLAHPLTLYYAKVRQAALVIGIGILIQAFTGSWWGLTVTLIGVSYAVIGTVRLWRYSVVPGVLVLGCSSPASLELTKKVAKAISPPVRVATLLSYKDSEEVHEGFPTEYDYLRTALQGAPSWYYWGIFRTVRESTSEWREVVRTLISMAPIVIVDLRGRSELLSQELAMIQRNNAQSRCLVVTVGSPDVPRELQGSEVLSCESVLKRMRRLWFNRWNQKYAWPDWDPERYRELTIAIEGAVTAGVFTIDLSIDGISSSIVLYWNSASYEVVAQIARQHPALSEADVWCTEGTLPDQALVVRFPNHEVTDVEYDGSRLWGIGKIVLVVELHRAGPITPVGGRIPTSRAIFFE
jgi:hypothetical protein